MIRRLMKGLLVLVVLAAIGVVVLAYLGPILFPAEFSAPQQDIRLPVTLGAGQGS